jgi:hypothetical protein
MLLITAFVELRVVTGRSRTRASRPRAVWTADANSHMPFHAHAAPMPHCAVVLRSRFHKGMVVAWHGRGMECVNQTRLHCVNQMGKTQSKPLAAQHGRGRAWALHGNGMICVISLKIYMTFA